MFSFIYMKILESQPRRYDVGISWLSLGAVDRCRHKIIERAVQPGDHVLDIGTGTGSLALLAAERGAEVVGIDTSAAMLAVAEQKRTNHPDGERVRFIEAGAAEMETSLLGETFDVVTASLVFSELSEDEQRYVLRQAHGLLKPGGCLVIADETRPMGLFKRVLYYLVRLPLAVLTFALTQTSTRPVLGLKEKVREAGYEIESTEMHNLGSYIMLYARKKGRA